MNRRLIAIMVIGGFLGQCLVRPAEAVLGVGDAVYDLAVHIESITTATQTTATAANTVEIIANQVLDLMSLEAWVMDNGEWLDMLQQMQGLLLQAQGLAWDINSLNAQITQLFELNDAPRTSLGYFEHQRQVRQFINQGWRYAMRTQTLMMTMQKTVYDIIRLYRSLKGLMGNKQALQTLAQYQQQILQTETQVNLHTATFERAKSVEAINETMLDESLTRLNSTVLDDWALGDNGQ